LNDVREAVIAVAKRYVMDNKGKWVDDHRAEMPNGDILVVTYSKYNIDEVILERYQPPNCTMCGIVRYQVVGVEKGVFAQLMCPDCGHRNERYVPPIK
jgi:predicted RNA-binding Zn-ribbon protein involved in translation (DUF1610 family)